MILSSTFVLTLLLAIGLFFFIRASIKDRTTEVRLVTSLPEAELFPQLKTYFQNRAYRVIDLDGDRERVTFEGYVRPSQFLAGLLSLLAACGAVCLALVLTMLLPGDRGQWALALVLLAPLAGWFYWRGAGRVEQVSVQIAETESSSQSAILVSAHRDEIIQLQRSLPLELASPARH